jgi:hypothetical protein
MNRHGAPSCSRWAQPVWPGAARFCGPLASVAPETAGPIWSPHVIAPSRGNFSAHGFELDEYRSQSPQPNQPSSA